jgi:hypothetical protein
VERAAPISADDFRTLNRCLDDAIASAVTEYSRGQAGAGAGGSQELRRLVNTALVAFDALRSGNVGVEGTTGTLVHSSLIAIRAFADRPVAGV